MTNIPLRLSGQRPFIRSILYVIIALSYLIKFGTEIQLQFHPNHFICFLGEVTDKHGVDQFLLEGAWDEGLVAKPTSGQFLLV